MQLNNCCNQYKKILTRSVLICCITFAIGCKSHTNKTSAGDSATSSTNTKTEDIKPDDETIVEGCFMQVLQRDTFAANLHQNGKDITGKLSFDNYEKDGSTGTVNGKLEDDVLKLFYSFASEGMNSVMEVYFKYSDGKLVRGTGDMENKGDTAYFTDAAAIQYQGEALQKLPCETLPAKYK